MLTATHSRIEHGSVYVKDGKIIAFGATITAPDGVPVVEANGKFVTPGMIDPHSHMALDAARGSCEYRSRRSSRSTQP